MRFLRRTWGDGPWETDWPKYRLCPPWCPDSPPAWPRDHPSNSGGGSVPLGRPGLLVTSVGLPRACQATSSLHRANKSPGQRLAEAGLPDSEESLRLAPGSSVDAQLTLVGKKAASKCTSEQPGRSDVQEVRVRSGDPTGSPQRRADPGLGSVRPRAPARKVGGGGPWSLLPAPGPQLAHLLTMMALTRPPGISQGQELQSSPHTHD